MTRSGFQSKAIPKGFGQFLLHNNVYMLCRDNKIKTAGQVNKERKRHAR